MSDDEIKLVGRPRKDSSMTAAQRKTKERARIRALAEFSNPQEWDERVCMLVLSSAKFSEERRHSAWVRLGQLNNWVESL